MMNEKQFNYIRSSKISNKNASYLVLIESIDHPHDVYREVVKSVAQPIYKQHTFRQ